MLFWMGSECSQTGLYFIIVTRFIAGVAEVVIKKEEEEAEGMLKEGKSLRSL